MSPNDSVSANPAAAGAGLPRHGGNVAEAEARFGRPAEGWLDLSTGINPFPYPLPGLPETVWRRLPDAAAEQSLRAVAAAAWNVDDPDRIVTAPGTQIVIQMLARLLPAGDVAIVGPTYPGHADAFALAGHRVVACADLDGVGAAPLAVLVNPNNPDGRRWPADRVLASARRLASRGGLLIVDESFADLAPELSVAWASSPGLLVLRSFGKFHGLAGLRLGFAVAAPDLARRLRAALGPWPVSGPALEIGRIALADRRWADETRARLAYEAQALDALLAQAGLRVCGGTSLFRLLEVPRAWALYAHLARRGILVRPFAEPESWLRIGLPPDDPARDRLAAALAALAAWR